MSTGMPPIRILAIATSMACLLGVASRAYAAPSDVASWQWSVVNDAAPWRLR